MPSPEKSERDEMLAFELPLFAALLVLSGCDG